VDVRDVLQRDLPDVMSDRANEPEVSEEVTLAANAASDPKRPGAPEEAFKRFNWFRRFRRFRWFNGFARAEPPERHEPPRTF
jgi:hypothetical protein